MSRKKIGEIVSHIIFTWLLCKTIQNWKLLVLEHYQTQIIVINQSLKTRRM